MIASCVIEMESGERKQFLTAPHMTVERQPQRKTSRSLTGSNTSIYCENQLVMRKPTWNKIAARHVVPVATSLPVVRRGRHDSRYAML
ncbi:hypothetical protein A9O66_35515 (plasmid) [Paraburkholderia caribensis]|uniref:Uncharacterized protein n=1 Tax=Paraburkholderia caribensis TaxID=75105 RepID=A0A9Q6SB88_9BURK|nr:hypothetical protein A9O66_35515 [Paraburkholderia caribensis]